MSETTEKGTSLVASIYSRIENQLPVRSKLSIEAYKTDPFYTESKALLINLSSTHYFEEIFENTIQLLFYLNEGDKKQKTNTTASSDKLVIVPLKDRSLTNLQSVYLVLKLLSDIAESTWKRQDDIFATKNPDFVAHESEADANPYLRQFDKSQSKTYSEVPTLDSFHTARPKTISSKNATTLLKFFANLKTNSDIDNTLKMITGGHNNNTSSPSPQSSQPEPSTFFKPKYTNMIHKDTFSIDFSSKDPNQFITLIDLQIDLIVSYLSASNPTEFFEHVNHKLKKAGSDAVVPRADLLAQVYLDIDNLESYLNLMKELITLKKTSQQNLLFAFFDISLDNWRVSRQLEYIKATKIHSIQVAADSLFELVFRFADWKIYYRSAYRFLSSLLLLMPSQFQRYLAEKNSKTSNVASSLSIKRLSSSNVPINKNANKQKVIADLVNIVHKHPSAGEAIAKILIAGAGISFLRTRFTFKELETESSTNSDYLAIEKFSKSMCKPLCRHFSLDHPDYYIPNVDTNTFDFLRELFFAAYIILEPEIVDTFVNSILRENKETLRHIMYMFNGLDLLIKIPLFFKDAQIRFHTVNSVTLPLLLKICKQFSSYEERIVTLNQSMLKLNENDNDDDNNDQNDNESSISRRSSDSMMDLMDVLQQNYVESQELEHSSTSNTTSTTRTANTQSSSSDTNSTKSATHASRPTLQQLQTVNLPSSSSSPSSSSTVHHSLTTSSAIKSLYKPTKNIASRVFQSVSSSSSSNNNSNPNSTTTSSTVVPVTPQSANTRERSPVNTLSNTSSDISPVNTTTSNITSPLNPQSQQSSSSVPTMSTNRSVTPISLSSPLSQHSSMSTNNNIANNLNNSLTSTEFVKPKYFLLNYEHPPSNYIKVPFNYKDMLSKVLKSLIGTYIKFTTALTETSDSSEAVLAMAPSVHDSLVKILFPLAKLLLSSDYEVKRMVSDVFLNVCASTKDAKSDVLLRRYFATGIIVDSISKISLDQTISLDEATSLMSFLCKFLDLREHVVDFDLLEEVSTKLSFHGTGGCGRMISNLEKSIYLGLFSSSLELYHISKRLLEHYLFIIDARHHLANCFQKYSVELCKAIVSEKSPAGEAAIRRKLRDHLCKLKGPTDSLLDIWEIMFAKFCKVHSIATNENGDYYATEDTKDKIFHSHDDFGEYIASLGGVIFSEEMEPNERTERLVKSLEFFFSYKTKNLFTNDHKRADIIKEVLCASVHPNCVATILRLLKYHVATFTESLRIKQFNICEMVILVTRTAAQADYEYLFPQSVTLIDLNLSMLNEMKEYDNNSEYNKDPVFQRLKLKLIKLQTLVASRMDQLALYGMRLKKNEYARIMVEYLENSFKVLAPITDNTTVTKVLDFSTKTKKNESDHKKANDNELLDIQYDICVEASAALKNIVEELPIDNYKNLGLARDSDDIISIFSHYFNLFVRILEHLNRDLNPDEKLDINMTIKHRSANIIKNVIGILINLLQSNVDLGIKAAIPLGFHEDKLLRGSFIKVFAKIVSEIKEKSNLIKSADYTHFQYKSLELLSKETSLCVACVQSCAMSEVDSLASAFMTMSDDKRVILDLLTNLIKYDILNTSDSVEILRSNTVATRMLAIFCKSEATNYVYNLLLPIFTELEKTHEHFEVERIKADDPTAKENVELFFKYLNMLIDSISNSISLVPYGLRRIANVVYEATSINFPESKVAALGAFFFLRIINPAVISPERVNIEVGKDPLRIRSLMQIARVLQLMANETISTLKWPLLLDHMDELEKLKSKVNHFMHEASGELPAEELARYERASVSAQQDDEIAPLNKFYNAEVDYESGYKFFHAFFYDHYTKICDLYLNPTTKDKVPMRHKIKVIRRINDFQKVVGIPARVKGYEIPQAVRNNKSEKGMLLYDFMSQYSLRGLDRGDFITVQTTRDGLSMISVIYRKIPESYTYDMVAYCFLQVLSKYWESPYCILADCTLFTYTFNPHELVRSVGTMVDEVYIANCVRYYSYNICTIYYEVARLEVLKALTTKLFNNAEVIFLSSADDQRIFHKNGLNLYQTEVSQDARVTFTDVSLYEEDAKRFISVKLMIGNEYLQIIENQLTRIKVTDKKMKSLRLVDIYRISDLRSIGTSKYTGVPDEISIYDDRTRKTIILSSSKKVEIMRTLYFSRTKYSKDIDENDLVRKMKEQEEEKDVLRASLGYMLHMSFTGLLSGHEDIRSASLLLLSSLTNSYNLYTGQKIETVPNMSVPIGDTNFTVRVSRSICENHPSLTYKFLSAFFDTYGYLKSRGTRSALIIYTSPWISQIYHHVLIADPKYGSKKATELVHKFVSLTKDTDIFVISLSKLIWGPLSLEDNIAEIVIDEITAAAIDHEAEGHGWESMVESWPLSPSIKLCDLFIQRLLSRSRVFMTGEISEVELHTRWIELCVLVKFLGYLIYNGDLFVNLYLGQLFYIISVYMDVGPSEFRASVLKLTTRVFHSFLNKESITASQSNSIKEKIEALNGARYRMLFGLTRSGDETLTAYKIPTPAEMINSAHATDAICDLLFSFVEDCGGSITNGTWLANWATNTLKLVFQDNAFLQSRAILIYGSLSRAGINNTVLYKFLGLTYKTAVTLGQSEAHASSKSSILVCQLETIRKMITKLPRHSHFVGKFFWFSTSLCLIDNFTFYQLGIQLLAQCMINADNETEGTNTSGLDFLFDQRVIFGQTLSIFENDHKLKITKETFDVVLLHMCVKGVLVPYSYMSAFITLKTIFRIRLKWEKRLADKEKRPVNINIFAYVLILYKLANNDEEATEIFEECGLTNYETVEISEDFHVPKQLIEFLTCGSLQTLCGVASSSFFINNLKNSDTAIIRNFELYNYVFSLDSEICWMVFEYVLPSLGRYAEYSKSLPIIKLVFPLMERMLLHPEYPKREEYKEILSSTIRKNNLEGVMNCKFSNSNPFDYSAEEKVPAALRKKSIDALGSFLQRIMSTHVEDE